MHWSIPLLFSVAILLLGPVLRRRSRATPAPTRARLADTEAEVVLLKATTDLIDSMVNFELFDVMGTDPDSQIMFHGATHQRFFNIALVDFLSQTDRKAPISQTTYLGALRAICEHPSFDVGGSVQALRQASLAFTAWLEQKVTVDTWLPSISKQVPLTLTRISFLKACGNISKHNFLRLGNVAEEIIETLAASGVSITLDEAFLVLADFYERFHTDILNYHSSTIAEFLNNILWGVHEYLQPEYQRSLVKEGGDPPKYRFTYPPNVVNEFAKTCYWDLLNEVRRRPYVRRFRVKQWLKLRY